MEQDLGALRKTFRNLDMLPTISTAPYNQRLRTANTSMGSTPTLHHDFSGRVGDITDYHLARNVGRMDWIHFSSYNSFSYHTTFAHSIRNIPSGLEERVQMMAKRIQRKGNTVSTRMKLPKPGSRKKLSCTCGQYLFYVHLNYGWTILECADWDCGKWYRLMEGELQDLGKIREDSTLALKVLNSS